MGEEGRDMGETGQTTGIHVGNWEVSAAPCTAQMDTSFKQLLSHLKTISDLLPQPFLGDS